MIAADGAARIPAVRMGRIAGSLGLVLILSGTLLSGGGCRPRRGADAGTGMTQTDPVSVESLRATLARTTSPAGIRGRGLVRIDLDASEELPLALDLRFEVGGSRDCRLMLRPGVLAPVLSLWADADGWSLWLPRQRSAFTSRTESAELGSEGPERRLPADAPSRLAWMLLAPHELLRSLEKTRLVERGPHWILRGRSSEMAPWVSGVEIWVVSQNRRIVRWALIGPHGETLLRVVYDDPWEGPRRGSGMVLLAPALGGAVRLELTQAEEGRIESRPRPDVPEGWARLPAEALPSYIEGLLLTSP